MVFTRICLGLAAVKVSVQQTFQGQPLYQQVPDMQMYYQQQTIYHEVPDVQMQYQQVPDMQMQYQQVPDIQMQVPSSEAVPEFQPEEVRPDDGSEECKAKRAENPLHSGKSELTIGDVYCSQAADSRWWDVTVKAMNCDGSYSVVVHDDVNTKWPVAQRIYFLDQPCSDFDRDATREEGSEEASEPLLDQDDSSVNVADLHQTPADNHVGPVETLPSPAQSRWSRLSDKTAPLKVITGAAAAGAVPLVYGLTGA